MAKYEDIEMLTVEEFMDGLDYAVKKKKRKLISNLKKEADKQYPNIKQENLKQAEKEDINYNANQNIEFVESAESSIENTQRTQALKDLYTHIDEKPQKKTKEKKKHNLLLLISFALGLLYSLYIIYYCFSMSGSGANDAENIGIGIGITLIMPHLICTVLATLFNGLGVFLNKRGFALTGAILYTIACVLMPIYFMFTIIQAILSYIGFAKLKKKVYIPIDER